MQLFYLCSLPLLNTGWETSYFQLHLLLFMQTLSFQRATEGSVGSQSTPKRFEDVTGIFHRAAAAHAAGEAQTAWLSLRGASTSHNLQVQKGDPCVIRVCCRGVPGPAWPWRGSSTTDPCPGGTSAGWERPRTLRPFSGSFQSKFLSHSRSGSDS